MQTFTAVQEERGPRKSNSKKSNSTVKAAANVKHADKSYNGESNVSAFSYVRKPPSIVITPLNRYAPGM